MTEANASPFPSSFVRGIEVRRESLLFVLDGYFHPQVICADPGGPCSRIEDTIHFLVRNLKWEEWQMEQFGYPEAIAHKRDHELILLRLQKMKNSFVCGRYDNRQVAQLIETWADQHALTYDKPFADFLNTCAEVKEK